MKRRTMLGAAPASLLSTMFFSAPSMAASTLTVMLPEPHGLTFRALYVGIEKGWFAAEGIELAFKVAPGGAVNLVPQLVQGAGDLAPAGGYTVIQARARGAPVVGIHAASSESLWSLISSQSANINKPADLKGKRLGVVAFSSATYFMSQGLLRAGGLSKTDVDIQPIGLGGPAALSQGQIDGYIWFATQGLALTTRGAKVSVMPLDTVIPLPEDMYLSTDKVVKERGADLKGFLRAFKRAEAWDHDPANWAEGTRYLAKWAPESVLNETFLKAYLQYTYERQERDKGKGRRWGVINPDRIDAAQRFLREIDVIERTVPLNEIYTNELLPS